MSSPRAGARTGMYHKHPHHEFHVMALQIGSARRLLGAEGILAPKTREWTWATGGIPF